MGDLKNKKYYKPKEINIIKLKAFVKKIDITHGNKQS